MYRTGFRPRDSATGFFFLESGQIAEQGTFEELMEQKGKYAEMFHSQAKYYAGSTYGEAEEHE